MKWSEKKIRSFYTEQWYFADGFLHCDITCRQYGVVPNLLTSGRVEIGLEWHWWIKGIHKILGARFQFGGLATILMSVCLAFVFYALFCSETPLRSVLTVFNFSPLPPAYRASNFLGLEIPHITRSCLRRNEK